MTTHTLLLAGDTMLGRNVADLLVAHPDTPLVDDTVAAVMRDADLCLLNLECCISDRGERWDDPDKPFFFRAPPIAADRLAELGVDAVSLANNHALDYGATALADTIAHLDRVGIAHVGAGPDRAAARRPVVLRTAGLQVGVLGASDHPHDFAAGEHTPGIALWADRTDDWPIESVRALAPAVDLVLATVHWGPNMVTAPGSRIRDAAGRLVTAGASVVAGHSAHVFHGVQWRRVDGHRAPVLYDLGDFVDDYATDPWLRNDLGLLWAVDVTDHRLAVRVLPLVLGHGMTTVATAGDREWILERLSRACAEFSTTVVDDDRWVHLTAR